MRQFASASVREADATVFPMTRWTSQARGLLWTTYRPHCSFRVLMVDSTRSGLPSPFRSPIATSSGDAAVGYATGAPKVPSPLLRRTATLLETVVTRSG